MYDDVYIRCCNFVMLLNNIGMQLLYYNSIYLPSATIFDKQTPCSNALAGTVVAMEKEPDILKASQTVMIEGLRDSLERDFTEYLARQNI